MTAALSTYIRFVKFRQGFGNLWYADLEMEIGTPWYAWARGDTKKEAIANVEQAIGAPLTMCPNDPNAGWF